MTDSEFDILASHTLHAIEVAIDAVAESADLDLDIQMKPGGILDIAFADGSRIIVNRQAPSQELWVAARAGGYHYRWDGAGWIDTRDQTELFAALSRLFSAQSGHAVIFAQPR